MDKTAVLQADCTEVADALARRVMKQDRIASFRLYSHSATGKVLLEVNFVERPKLYRRIQAQGLEFYLCARCLSGSARAIRGSVCRGESLSRMHRSGLKALTTRRIDGSRSTSGGSWHPVHKRLQSSP